MQNYWLDEVQEAPRDAWALLLGLASANSVFALVRHEFVSRPLQLVQENWRYWSHELWSWLAGLINVSLPRNTTAALTVALLFWAVYQRGKLQGQIVSTFDTSNFGMSIVLAIMSLVMVIAGFLIVVGLVTAGGKPELVAEGTHPLIGMATLVAILWSAGFSGYAFLRTPRSFFGVVIAAVALLLIDRIPFLPAASVGAQ